MYRILYPWSILLCVTSLVLSFDLYKNSNVGIIPSLILVILFNVFLSLSKNIEMTKKLFKNFRDYSLVTIATAFNCNMILSVSILKLSSPESLKYNLGFFNGTMSAIGMLLIILSVSMIYYKFTMLYYYKIVKEYNEEVKT